MGNSNRKVSTQSQKNEITQQVSNKSDELLIDYNPFEILHENLSTSIKELSLLPNTTEMDYFIRIIVRFIGYIESTFKNQTTVGGVACSSPNNISTNETCILLSIPYKSKHYQHYTISNIKFQSLWEGVSKLIVNISLFDKSLYIDDMQSVYKSKEICIQTDATRPLFYDDTQSDCGDQVQLNDINVTLKCGEIYIFWLDVISGFFNFAFSEYQVDGLRQKYPLLTNLYMRNWRDKAKYEYDITDNVRKAKLFEIEFC
eukprot:61992_1